MMEGGVFWFSGFTALMYNETPLNRDLVIDEVMFDLYGIWEWCAHRCGHG